MAKKKKKKPTGKNRRRAVTYKDYLTDEGLIKLEGWARDGLTNAQIAHNIGIAEGTIYAWMKDHPKIDEALKKGKEVIDRQVENALLKRALGYEYEEVKIEQTEDGYKRTVTTKLQAGDTTAQIFWLKNRKPEEWRDKREIEHSGEIDSRASREMEERLMQDEKSRELLEKLWEHTKGMESDG